VSVVRRAQAARLQLQSLLTELEPQASAASDDSDGQKLRQEIAAVFTVMHVARGGFLPAKTCFGHSWDVKVKGAVPQWGLGGVLISQTLAVESVGG